MAKKPTVAAPQWPHHLSHGFQAEQPHKNPTGPNIARDATRGKATHVVATAFGQHRRDPKSGALYPSGVSAVASGGQIAADPTRIPPAPKLTHHTARGVPDRLAQLGRVVLAQAMARTGGPDHPRHFNVLDEKGRVP